jgi:hypothetical protein
MTGSSNVFGSAVVIRKAGGGRKLRDRAEFRGELGVDSGVAPGIRTLHYE